ncbi:calcium-binding protein [Skermanella stibiiresistens SB22]|uniref:Calcium-binding protein n=1 Tax=Skermanella stibiiresistens SB22 TaxID=1385369 RepID=W9H8U7_9PROT|nr:CAP domain-containing protein [Skermanella stibiiresistens]EWY40228.1 calcium-binding protein [Skermanella stibiiresistens SB22]
MTEPTALDQYLIELVNRARLDPAAEAARLGIDVNQGLAEGQISLAPKQPLAFNATLGDSALGHAQWMLETDEFSHSGVDGSDPGIRMAEAGYEFTGDWRWGENISWRGTIGPAEDTTASVSAQHDALFLSASHRVNILQDDFREIGTATPSGEFMNYNAVMVDENFGKTGTGVFLTGVAYDDLDADDFYTPGEGRAGITVTAVLQGSPEPVVLTDVTATAGGYDIPAQPGNYVVTFSGGGLASPIVQTATVGTENVKLDLIDPGTGLGSDGQVAGASGTADSPMDDATLSSIWNFLQTEARDLDVNTLIDHVGGGQPVPEAWLPVLQQGAEFLRAQDLEKFADEFANYVELLGVPHGHNPDDGFGA